LEISRKVSPRSRNVQHKSQFPLAYFLLVFLIRYFTLAFIRLG
jgi:hypothetical protein